MNLHGVDVYVRSDDIPNLDESYGNLRLLFMSNRGTKVFPPPAPKFKFIGIFRCRFFSESEVTDQEVDQLLTEITKQGYKTSQFQKLFMLDGVKQFSEPY